MKVLSSTNISQHISAFFSPTNCLRPNWFSSRATVLRRPWPLRRATRCPGARRPRPSSGTGGSWSNGTRRRRAASFNWMNPSSMWMWPNSGAMTQGYFVVEKSSGGLFDHQKMCHFERSKMSKLVFFLLTLSIFQVVLLFLLKKDCLFNSTGPGPAQVPHGAGWRQRVTPNDAHPETTQNRRENHGFLMFFNRLTQTCKRNRLKTYFGKDFWIEAGIKNSSRKDVPTRKRVLAYRMGGFLRLKKLLWKLNKTRIPKHFVVFWPWTVSNGSQFAPWRETVPRGQSLNFVIGIQPQARGDHPSFSLFWFWSKLFKEHMVKRGFNMSVNDVKQSDHSFHIRFTFLPSGAWRIDENPWSNLQNN